MVRILLPPAASQEREYFGTQRIKLRRAQRLHQARWGSSALLSSGCHRWDGVGLEAQTPRPMTITAPA